VDVDSIPSIGKEGFFFDIEFKSNELRRAVQVKGSCLKYRVTGKNFGKTNSGKEKPD